MISTNNEKSHFDDYLVVVLGFGAKHPDAKVNLGTLVRRHLENNLKLKRKLAAGYDASGGKRFRSRTPISWRLCSR